MRELFCCLAAATCTRILQICPSQRCEQHKRYEEVQICKILCNRRCAAGIVPTLLCHPTAVRLRPRGDAKLGGCFTDGIFAHGFHLLRRRSVKFKSGFHDNVMTPRTCPPHVPMACRRNREKCTCRLNMSMRCTCERIRHGIRPKPPLKEGNCIYGRRTTPTLRAPNSPNYASLCSLAQVGRLVNNNLPISVRRYRTYSVGMKKPASTTGWDRLFSVCRFRV